jgi:hypothetical protein
VDVEISGNLSVDLFEEVKKLVPLVALTDDKAEGDVERCEQRRRAMTEIVVRSALRHTRHHRQDRLVTVERLDFALFINAQDHCPSAQQFHRPYRQRIARKLKGLRAMRLHAKGRPNPADRRVRKIRWHRP